MDIIECETMPDDENYLVEEDEFEGDNPEPGKSNYEVCTKP